MLSKTVHGKYLVVIYAVRNPVISNAIQSFDSLLQEYVTVRSFFVHTLQSRNNTIPIIILKSTDEGIPPVVHTLRISGMVDTDMDGTLHKRLSH